jgi:hypothetical protein
MTMNHESQAISLKTELAKYCQSHQITKFAPEEIIELLQDGETVDWLMSMLVPADQRSQHVRLAEILTAISAEVQPAKPSAPPETAVEFEPELTETGDVVLPAEQREEPVDIESTIMSMLPAGIDKAQVKKFMSSPQAALLADFAAFCQERGVDPQGMNDGQMPEEVFALQQEWMQTPRPSLEGKTPGELLKGQPIIPKKVETVRRTEPKVGRNDPCPCGSGKKYKKCHGAGLAG